ncbi:transposable element Tcb1 transposase [Trichonephila clavipes]|nr:transposable element Tcb1 transposase [Trichonephila clavipes]
MAVMNHLATSQTIKQQIQPVTHHSVSISYLSTWFTPEWNVRKASIASFTFDWRLRRQWNYVVFIDEPRFRLQHHDGWIRVWRHHVRSAGTLNSQRYISVVLDSVVLPYVQRLSHQPYSNRIMHYYTKHTVFKSSSLPIRFNFLPWLACSPGLSSIKNV